MIRASLTRPAIGDLICVNSRLSPAECLAASAPRAARRGTLIVCRSLIKLTHRDRVLSPEFLRAIELDLGKFQLGLGPIQFR